MLKGLRKRLAAIFTVFTGTVLAAVLGVSFYQSVQQTVVNRELWFSNTVDTVASTVFTNALGEEHTRLNPGQYIICAKVDGQDMQGLLATPAEKGGQTGTIQVTESDRQAMFAQAKSMAEEKGLTNWVAESYTMYDSAMGHVSEDAGYAFSAEGIPAAEGQDILSSGMVAITIAPVLGTEGIFTMDYNGGRYRATYFTGTLPRQEGNAPGTYEIAVMESLSPQTRDIWLNGLRFLVLLAAGLALLFLANWFLAKLVLRPTEDGLRRQTEFVAAASHELRSPLAVIRASLSAEESAENTAAAVKFHTAAADEAERMSHLVDDLLLLAGGDAGSWQLHKAPVDLDTLLIDLAEGYEPLARDKSIKLVLDLPQKTLPKVQGDAQRLRQILSAILDNALQYAPADTTVTLSATAKKGKACIKVADRGRGIPDEDKEKVFERFYRADESRHDKAHFGLGLAVAKELAQLHGGQLAAGDTENGGATFTLTLPVT